MVELAALGRSELVVDELTATNSGEFLVRLRCTRAALPTAVSPDERLALLWAIANEQAFQQTSFTPALKQRLIALLPPGHPIETIPVEPSKRVDPAEPSKRVDPAKPIRQVDPAEPIPWGPGLRALAELGAKLGLNRLRQVNERLKQVGDRARRWTQRHESAPPAPPLTRQQKAHFGMAMDGEGVEFGPSISPLAPKSQGFRVHIVDHAPAAELRNKYRVHNVDISQIEDVDHVWNGEPLDQLLGTERRYDWMIASHLVEHIPDLLAFLQQCERLLKPDGILSLIVPDLRYCFDHLRFPTTTGDLLQAFIEQRRRHPPGVTFDHVAQQVKKAGEIVWHSETPGDLTLTHKLADAKAMFDHARSTPDYVDAHCWRFTPSSFRLILTELRLLGLLHLEEVHAFPSDGQAEFFVTLRPTSIPLLDADRLALHHKVQAEIQIGLK